jgi:ribA/ribD-fused uncharacterized protein
MAIYFYVPGERYGAFSNFSRHGVELDGAWWPTVEHFFQAQKFEDPAYREKIRTVALPRDAKNLGRTRDRPLRADWDAVRDGVMLRAVRRKFETHPEIRALLLETGEEEIVENAPGDFYWGAGADGSGQNKLGKILMQVRGELRSST